MVKLRDEIEKTLDIGTYQYNAYVRSQIAALRDYVGMPEGDYPYEDGIFRGVKAIIATTITSPEITSASVDATSLTTNTHNSSGTLTANNVAFSGTVLSNKFATTTGDSAIGSSGFFLADGTDLTTALISYITVLCSYCTYCNYCGYCSYCTYCTQCTTVILPNCQCDCSDGDGS